MLSDYAATDDEKLGFGYMLDCCFSGVFLFKALEVMEKKTIT